MEAQPARGRHIARHTKVNLDCLYEMVVRNGFFVPSKKCSFVTVNYLCSVKVSCPISRKAEASRPGISESGLL